MTDAIDDFEALFDEVAAQRTDSVPSSPPAPVINNVEAVVEPLPSAEARQTAAGQAEETVGNAPQNPSTNPMYERLGGIVRMLHDSLRELGYDRSLSNVADQISDAQGRLEHVAMLTEQAANKVLNTVDTCMPDQETLGKTAKEMEERWTHLFGGKLSIEEFKILASDSKQFAATVLQSSDAEKARLLDIMMAQDFQDITGQLIKKIVTITHQVERELAQLLRDNAPPEVKAAMAEAAENKAPELLMQGPAAPGAAMAQDDVDSLLADLGF